MTRTKRAYNKPNHIKDFYHPWKQFCCGNCKMCKDSTVSKKRRLAYKEDLRYRIKMEPDILAIEDKYAWCIGTVA
jgi:hypothetical protein